MLSQSDDTLKAYLTSIKGSSASMSGYTVSLQGNITGFKKVSAAISQYNQLASQGVAEQQIFSNAVSVSNTGLGTYLSGLNGTKATMGGYITSLIGAKAKTIGLQIATAALNATITMGLSLAISGLVSLISKWVNAAKEASKAFEKATENAKKYKQEISDIQSEFEKKAKSAKELAETYEKLSKGVDTTTNKNISLTNDQYEEFLDVNNQLAELFPSLTRNYDENGNAILNLGGNIETVTGKIAALVEQQERLANVELRKNLETYFDGDEEAGGQFDVLEGLNNKVIDATKKLSTTKNRMDAILSNGKSAEFVNRKNLYDYYKDFGLTQDELEKIIKSTQYNQSAITYWFDFSLLKLDEKRKEEIQEYCNSIYADLSNALYYAQKEFDTANKETSSMAFAWLEDESIYKHAGTQMQRMMQIMINNINWLDLEGVDTYDEVKQWLTNNILLPIDNMVIEDKDKLLNAMESLFAIDISKLSLADAKAQIEQYLNEITNLLHIDLTELKISFGFENIDTLYDNLRTVNNKAINKWLNNGKLSSMNAGETFTALEKFANENSINTQNEIALWNQCLEESNSVIEAQNKYLERIKEAEVITPFKLTEEHTEALSEYKSQIDSISSALSDLDNLTANEITELMAEFSDEKYGAIFQKWGVTGEKGVGDLKSALVEIAYIVMETATDAVPQLTSAIEEMFDVISNPSGDNLAKLNKTQSELKELLSLYNSESYSISADRANTDNVTELINKYPELADAINLVGDAYVFEKEALEGLINTRIEDMNTIASSEYQKTMSQLEDVQNQIAGYENARSAELESRNLPTSYLMQDPQYRALVEYEQQLQQEKIRLEEMLTESITTGDLLDKDSKSEIFDWYETAISRLEETISDYGDTVDDVYSTWEDRNDAIRDKIEETTNLIAAQVLARDAYYAKADAVGLDQSWIDKIKSGDFNIDDFTDEELIEQIKEYLEWYEKALDMDKAAEESRKKRLEDQKQSLEFMRSQYDAEQAQLESEKKRIQDAIDLNGGKGTVDQYNELISKESQLYKVAEDRLKKEQEILDALKPGSEAYEEQLERIRECEDELAGCVKNTKDWQIEILKLPIGEITDEIEDLNEQIESIDNNISNLDRMFSGAVAYIQDEIDTQEKLKEGIQDQIDALQEANDERERSLALEKAKYELERAQSQRVKKVYKGDGQGFVYEQDHDAVRDARENLSNLEFEETIHALEKQIEYYDKIIEDLQEVQDAWSNIAGNAQDVLDIQYALALLGEEGIFNTDAIKGFENQHASLLGDKESLENDVENLEDLEQAGNDVVDTFANGEITIGDAVNGVNDAIAQFNEATGQSLESISTNTVEINTNVTEAANSTTGASEETNKALEETAKGSETTAETVGEAAETINESMQGLNDTVVAGAQVAAETVADTLIETVESVTTRIGDMVDSATAKVEKLRQYKAGLNDNNTSATKIPYAVGGNSSDAHYVKGVREYHTGLENGLVGEKDAGDKIKALGLRKLEPDEIPAILKMNEAVLTQLQQQNVVHNFASAFKAGINSSVVKNNSSIPVVQNITLTLPNVTNESGYNRLVQELQGLQLDAMQYAKRR